MKTHLLASDLATTEKEVAPRTRKYPVRVVRVVDGDTLEVVISIGFYVEIRTTLRLFGVNCPEMRGPTQEQGESAKKFVEEFVAKHGPWMMAEITKSEKYGRWLAKLRARNGSELNKLLVARGHAVPYMVGI